MSDERRPMVPAFLWGLWLLTVVALVLAFTPLRDWTQPLATVAFFGIFGAFETSAPKGIARRPLVAFVQNAAPLAILTLGVAVSSWGNGWYVVQAALICANFVVRYGFFGRLGYTGLLWFEGATIAGAVVCYVVGGLQSDGWVGWAAMAIFVPFALFGIVATTLRQLKMVRATRSAIGVGEAAPDFSLLSHRDEEVRLSDFKGKRAVLLFFVRGDWCPGCHIMLRAYQQQRANFVAKNVAVLAIGPDPTGVNREMVETLGLEYGLLYDEGLEVARRYRVIIEGRQPGLPYEEGMPLPASFLIDEQGVIRFTSHSQSVGTILEPEAILPALDALPQ
jgi:peroxiredoxin